MARAEGAPVFPAENAKAGFTSWIGTLPVKKTVLEDSLCGVGGRTLSSVQRNGK
jgi:hypothetical protein